MPSAEKTYWKSLDRLLDSPAVREELGEFPPGASEPPDETSRRSMLQLLGASFALAGLAACRRPVEKIVPYVSGPEELVPGIPERYATTLPLGTSAYGLVVESHEGRPTKVEGNELHPASGGAAGAWAQAAVLGLYDPDRSRSIRRRDGGGEHAAASWEDFVAWAGKNAAAASESNGAGFVILSPAFSSPTLAGVWESFLGRYGEARWVVHEPMGDENVYQGLALATGEPLRPVYRLEKARRLVCLDADLLGAESESVAHARGFGAGRRVAGGRGEMSRLYVAESAMTVTGAQADHRLRVPSREIGSLVLALAAELGLVAAPGGLRDELRRRIRTLARDLLAHRGEALVAAGRGQPPAVHALVFAINQALGAVGATVSFRELRDAGWGSHEELASLAEDMRRGAVETLVVLGGNPVYTAPAELGFADALRAVPTSVHLSTHYDETSRLATWHLPEAHFLEAWSDARSAEGTPSVVQPLIAPLHGGKTAAEVAYSLLRGRQRTAIGLVRQRWLEDDLIGGSGFDEAWNRTLHDGLFPSGALSPAEAALSAGAVEEAAALVAAGGGESGPEIVFQLSAQVHDGRFANNGWLQEMPEPVTKLTWDNAILVSPTTAAELGLASGDVARLSAAEQEIEAPVLVAPGQADGSLALALGYGRRAAGRVGDGVGTDAYALRSAAAPYFRSDVQVERTGRRHDFALTQKHHTMAGRGLVREASLEEYRADPAFARHDQENEAPELWAPHEYSEGHQWGMTIDLNACIGCNACTIACQSENNVPVVGKAQVARGREMHWLRVDRYFAGGEDDPEVVFQPVPCMHCENAPCEQVCPVAATVHDAEGLNAMVYNRCIGTRYCSNNCPYKVRRFNFFNYTRELPDLVQLAQNPDVTVRSRGVMEKCTYCVQRISETKRDAKAAGRPLADGEIQTACQQTCPTQAIAFGDTNDPGSEVSRRKQDSRNYTLLAELNNRPRTSYLARLRNPNPEWDA